MGKVDRKRRQAAIAEAIRDELAARAVPPKWLVENAELAVNTVSGILMKGSMPHADTTAAIEAAFGWEPGELAQRAANTVIVKPGGLTVVIPASVVAGLSGLQLEEVSLIARLAAIERVRVYHASGDVAPPPPLIFPRTSSVAAGGGGRSERRRRVETEAAMLEEYDQSGWTTQQLDEP